ncbi:MAG: hypothetical protein AABW88_02290 [Nanoarchaeota archaeon]
MATFQESKQTIQPRQVAYIVRIDDIHRGTFVKEDGWNPSYVKIGDKNVARINIISAIIESSDNGNYQNILIDDGTGKISVRNFERKIDVNVGNIVLLVGRVRQFGSDKYIVPEIVKKNVDKKWSAIWKKTAIKNNINDEEISEKEEVEIISEKPKHDSNDIISKIRDLDDSSGVSYSEIVKNSDDEKMIAELLLRGDVFEIKPGRLKVLD